MRVNYYWNDYFVWDLVMHKPQKWEWVKDTTTPFDCYIDLACFNAKNDGRKKIAITRELEGHYQHLHDWLKVNYGLFDYIFTLDKELLELPNARFCIYGDVWYTSEIKPEEKTKNVSFCATNKAMVPSHLERKKLASLIHDKVDMKGDLYNPGKRHSTKEIYEDYRFSIVFECEKNDLCFTEKLCNAFANRCVPINYGCTDLAKYGFDTDGVIQITNIQQIVDLINSDFNWEEEYNKRLPAIEHNYEAVKKYRRFEDWLVDTYPEIWEELNGNNQ